MFCWFGWWWFWVDGLVFGFGWVWWFCGFAWFLASWVCYNIVFLGLVFVSGIFGLLRVTVGGCGGFSRVGGFALVFGWLSCEVCWFWCFA